MNKYTRIACIKFRLDEVCLSILRVIAMFGQTPGMVSPRPPIAWAAGSWGAHRRDLGQKPTNRTRQFGDRPFPPDRRQRHLLLERHVVLLSCPLHVLLLRSALSRGQGFTVANCLIFRVQLTWQAAVLRRTNLFAKEARSGPKSWYKPRGPGERSV